MGKCDFCVKCDPPNCPKKKPSSGPTGYVWLSKSVNSELRKICEEQKLMKGEDYYMVPDYDAAVSFLLKKQSSKKCK